ncbi:hypothetical protein VDG1235_3377 [Verrucomicrobiia bacterium DG1235]|nr:hypothetical protein VDG1235_3377 [Verrucomicrobiae bacterium DG1235]
MRLAPTIVFTLYILLSIVCAINPYDRAVWWAENIPIWIVMGIIFLVSRAHSFSNTSYVLMAIFPMLHTIGGHYTFERVPFGAITEFFEFSRNHFDRLAHFSVGFYAYPFAEYLRNKVRVQSSGIVYFFPFCFILALAGFYEIVEWLYAVSADPEAGIAVLGSQGDIWDAQKDMLADSLGAICVLLYAGIFRTLKDSPNYLMGK